MSVDRRRSLVPIALLVTLGTAACGKPAAEEVASETVVPVRTKAAEIGDIRGIVHATGIVTPSPGAELIVVAPEAARITEIPRAAGEPVRRGDVLVRFDVPTSVADLRRQEAEVVRARVGVENAKSAQARASELFERGVAARREVEDSNRAAADAEASLAEAQAALTSAQAVAQRGTVRATFDGVVARRFHNPGDLVEATAGDPVLRVIDPRRLEIAAAVPLGDAARIEVGATAHVTGGPTEARALRSRVAAGPSVVEAGAATVSVRLSLTGPARIPAGTPVQIDIEAERHANVVLIPVAAIVRDGDDTAVFVVAGDKAQRRSVRVGLADGVLAEIVSGVASGEVVIVDGQAGLPDGATLAVSDETGEPKSKDPDAPGIKHGAK